MNNNNVMILPGCELFLGSQICRHGEGEAVETNSANGEFHQYFHSSPHLLATPTTTTFPSHEHTRPATTAAAAAATLFVLSATGQELAIKEILNLISEEENLEEIN